MARVAINGLGRIGRAFLKLALERPELDVVAVNDLGDPGNLAYLMRHASVYGRYDRPVAFDQSAEPSLTVGDRRLRFLQQRDPAKLPWAALEVDIVVEATGVIETYERARAHLAAGARRVVPPTWGARERREREGPGGKGTAQGGFRPPLTVTS